jgi:hypothetical protein
MNIERLIKNGFKLTEVFSYDVSYQSYIFEIGDTCIIIDDNITSPISKYGNKVLFDYSKYCDMQNYYMFKYSRLFRFNFTCDEEKLYETVMDWLNKQADEITYDDNGGSFDFHSCAKGQKDFIF